MIRWCKEKKETGLMGAFQGHRHWYLQNLDNDQVYMRIEFRDARADKPAGWVFKICNPPLVQNKVSTARFETEGEAKLRAEEWWARNREQHLKLWKEHSS